MLRSEREFINLLLCELPNGDFAQTITRQFLFDAYQLVLWDLLATHPDPTLAGVAAKALMEARYHFRFSSSWVVRLGDGTDESHSPDGGGSRTLCGHLSTRCSKTTPVCETPWDRLVDPVLADANLNGHRQVHHRHGGRQGIHTEILGHLLAEMQSVAR